LLSAYSFIAFLAAAFFRFELFRFAPPPWESAPPTFFFLSLMSLSSVCCFCSFFLASWGGSLGALAGGGGREDWGGFWVFFFFFWCAGGKCCWPLSHRGAFYFCFFSVFCFWLALSTSIPFAGRVSRKNASSFLVFFSGMVWHPPPDLRPPSSLCFFVTNHAGRPPPGHCE